MEEKAACQQYLAGIANLILGMTMYYSQNCEFDNKATEQISKAKVFIRENLLKGIGPEEVADSLHMSYSWFRKLFKEYTGLSPAHYIQELKIQQAKDLLAITKRSTKEIAYYLTFDDIPYFTKVFKKYTGYTPQSYRKNSEENKKQPPYIFDSSFCPMQKTCKLARRMCPHLPCFLCLHFINFISRKILCSWCFSF